MQQYHDLVQTVLDNGVRKPNRTGIDTLATFGHMSKYDLQEGFPLLTTKSISWKNIVVELLWFLSGDTDIALLKKHGCKFWDPWANSAGKVPSAYGHFWRFFPAPHRLSYGEYVRETKDQIRWALDTLQNNPTSRRAVVSAWAPSNAHRSKLPPCHIGFVLNAFPTETGNYSLNLAMTQRSCDIALGVPYNIASYSLLLSLFARILGMDTGLFTHFLVDAHIYTANEDGTNAEFDHVPGLKEQLTRAPRPLPKLVLDPSIQSIDDIPPLLNMSTNELMQLFKLEGYNPHPPITFKVAV